MLRPCALARVRDPSAAPAGSSFLLAERRAALVGAIAAAHVSMTELLPARFRAVIAQHDPRRRTETGRRADGAARRRREAGGRAVVPARHRLSPSLAALALPG